MTSLYIYIYKRHWCAKSRCKKVLNLLNRERQKILNTKSVQAAPKSEKLRSRLPRLGSFYFSVKKSIFMIMKIFGENLLLRVDELLASNGDYSDYKERLYL